MSLLAKFFWGVIVFMVLKVIFPMINFTVFIVTWMALAVFTQIRDRRKVAS